MGGGVLEGLGAAAESAALRNLDDFLPTPWRYLHSRHLAKVRAVGGDGALAALEWNMALQGPNRVLPRCGHRPKFTHI